jgi:demethylmenaquinone methyltransferase/2-methoxy-6-polyprenyl-1,4-benzoquinol methylase
MLRVGRSKIERRGLTGTITLVRGDATQIPAADASVDAVTVAFGIRNVERTEVACAEMRRVLVPGGRLAVLEFAIPRTPGVRAMYLWYFNHVLPRVGRLISRHNAAYGYLPASVSAFASPEDFVRLLQRVGFSDVTARPLTLGIVYMFTARRK